MSYIVFARKYRPQTFDDVVGQSHITTTLKNAIEQSRVAHAYLFAGPRGTGKTTTARIFAKALNCEKGPARNPCNKCSSCREITQGSSLDILEIDGASNRGIEEIRNLRENAKFAPSKGYYKVYIIDEVHMLTAEAFNALLKTLEEPPAHIKFIFATTSPHKVPATILSRCQRFDFRRIPARDILANLKDIVQSEKIKIKDDALGLIAKYGDGSMRDAQVILDQVSSFGHGKVSVDDVSKMLGLVGDEMLFELSDTIKNRDPKTALGIVDRIIYEGKDVLQVVLALIEHFRNICVVKISKKAEGLLEVGPDKLSRYRELAESFTVEECLYAVYTLSNAIDFIRKSNLARVCIESALIKLSRNPVVVPIPELLSRISALEKAVRKGQIVGKSEKVSNDPGISIAPVSQTSEASGKSQGSQGSHSSCLLSVDDIAGYWSKLVSYIRPRKISIASYLEEGYPVSLESGTLSIGFPKECKLHKEVLETLENKRFIEDVLKEITGSALRIELKIVEPNVGSNSVIQGSGRTGLGGMGPDEEIDESDPIVKAAMDIFGGKVAGNGTSKGRSA